MTLTTLRDLVQLWQNVHSCDVKPTVFISQKLQDYQLDKIETYRSSRQPYSFLNHSNAENGPGPWIVYSTEICQTNKNGARRNPVWSVTTYKRIAAGCRVDFQLKPPVKNMFNGIYGPYKNN